MPKMLEILHATTLYATPLVVAAVGELVVERAGVVNIGIEGMMLTGALAAWVANGFCGPGWGLVASVLAAALLAALFALAILTFAADQIVTGTGINLLAFGATALAYKRLDPVMAQRTITAINPVWMMATALALLALTWAFFRFMRGGLELTAIGEAPEAADAAGLGVDRRKQIALLFGAACAAMESPEPSDPEFARFEAIQREVFAAFAVDGQFENAYETRVTLGQPAAAETGTKRDH